MNESLLSFNHTPQLILKFKSFQSKINEARHFIQMQLVTEHVKGILLSLMSQILKFLINIKMSTR